MKEMISNRYKILSLIGQGGMADVYKANDMILNRIVAIKILRKKLNDDAMALVRFQREASAASRLSHPNVVDIYDVGEDNGLHYIVMEYIRGRTLKQLLIKRGALSQEESIYIMKQLVSAVKQAHEHNIIHRDIKPQNVLVKDDGRVKITDFGIALAGDSVQLTLNNAVMGSAHYLAPESAKGSEPTKQIDIYSLGIVFYELLTGIVPYTGKTPTEIALKHLREPFPYPRNIQPKIAQSVENIVLKATAKMPEDRYSSCAEMLFDLEHCMDEEYRYMKRLSFEYPDEEELENAKRRQKEKDKSKRSNYILGGVAAGIILTLTLLGLLSFGIIRISGLFGYESMPNIIGMTEKDALKLLEEEGFDISKVTITYDISDEFEKGEVIDTQYEPGKAVKKDGKMKIVVCKGPSFLVEEYVNRSLQDVIKEFEKLGVNIEVKVEYKGMKDYDPGTILEQKGLDAGKRIDPDKKHTITFVVSEYPSLVIPKDLLGKDVDKAKKELNELGIAVITKPINGYEGVYFTVVDVNPAVGEKYVQEGTDSVVTLYYD
ncbi:MAG: Stk1 family PASTA domain-containing Ser/Thr kinase [Holdemanella sp.]|nr:Stk1 family PASTA domain-containing Ser/Thr kinase [Holdemanella sp.]